ncbi:hypothetical protein Lal_00017503 [Lupinus albus]|uniref:Uncharacterized protein n=1 Tax=Lupinus albus TaxID=3870 RepID=A0A6A4QTK1_LUPAL|nr:hypothetical protein Lalb_Chr04g0263371 [Lupinus albus]KAF1869926.1 hypothetical protein Lal_00017503 [Lupinus albus]
MEKWDKHQRKQHHIETPSFSSSLLDVIYRSIDEGAQTKEKQEKLIFYREAMRKKNGEDVSVCEVEKPNIHKVKRVENLMEKKVNEKVVMGRNSLTELERRARRNSNTLSMYSSSSSSESSSIGGFSSSESELLFYGMQKPKPIRTSFSYEKTNFEKTQEPKHHENNGFGKTKSKALRSLYGDLKKAKKQPISPGAKLASFLNSLFTSGGNAKKAKLSSSSSSRSYSMHESSKSTTQASSASAASTCSSVSSFSRSCLSKTPSSTRSGAKRSVRFCPVSVIVDEDCRPCGHKNLHEVEESMKVKNNSNSNEELRFHVMQESIRVEEIARELLKNYQKKNEEDFDIMHCEDEDEDDDDDGVSCESSDLFELDNLSAIGIERYREELPVYETTHFNTNRVIANGFIM